MHRVASPLPSVSPPTTHPTSASLSAICPSRHASGIIFPFHAAQIEEQGLIDFFADCGAVEKVDWIIDKESGKFYGTVRDTEYLCAEVISIQAFVEFASPEAAAESVKLNGQEVLGRPIKVEFSRPKTTKAGTTARNGDRCVSECCVPAS